MQVKKDNLRQIIVEKAREEFLQNGFKNTSMRTISLKSDVGLSNIYNYFASKDEIFSVVLAPLIKIFDDLTKQHNEPENITIDWFKIENYQQKMLDDFLEIIENFRPELKLLLFGAVGSSFEFFSEKLIDQYTELGIEYFELMKQKYPEINSNISKFFIHTSSSWWLTIITEIVSHDELTNDEIKDFIKDYITFGTAGWKTLMNIDYKK